MEMSPAAAAAAADKHMEMEHKSSVGCKIMTIRVLLVFLVTTSLLTVGLETYNIIRSRDMSYHDPLTTTPIDTIIRASDFVNSTALNSSLDCTAEDSIPIPESDKRISICSTPSHKIKIDLREFHKGKPSWLGLQISPKELRQFELSFNKIWWYITKHQARLDSFLVRYP